MREDGRYSIRLTIDNKQYGEYLFIVKGGRIELQRKQTRENTGPIGYIVDHLSVAATRHGGLDASSDT